MKTIGFCGGSSLCELGPVADVVLFFRCIDSFVVKAFPEKNWALLSDRLYRRYLHLEEIGDAVEMMDCVNEKLSSVLNTDDKWKELLLEASSGESWLDLSQPNLAEIFKKYFSHFSYCVESAQIFFKQWNIYQAIKTVPTDIAGFSTEKARPLGDYDSLDGLPFWLR